MDRERFRACFIQVALASIERVSTPDPCKNLSNSLSSSTLNSPVEESQIKNTHFTITLKVLGLSRWNVKLYIESVQKCNASEICQQLKRIFEFYKSFALFQTNSMQSICGATVKVSVTSIRITSCPCNIHPHIPHFHIAKPGNAGVYLFFLFLLQFIDFRYSLEPPR